MEEGAEPYVLSVGKSDDEPVEAHSHHTDVTNGTLSDDSNEYVYHYGFYTVSDQTAEHNGAESVSDITETSTNGFKSSVSTNNITSTEGIQSPMEELHIIEISDLNSSPKDNKTLYEESQSKLSERTEHFLKQVLNLTSDYNDEKTNYDELQTKHEELLATNANIVCDHEVVIATYKAIIIEKDAIISAK